MGNLQLIIDGAASEAQWDAFAEAWHGRVGAVLTDDALFAVEPVASG